MTAGPVPLGGMVWACRLSAGLPTGLAARLRWIRAPLWAVRVLLCLGRHSALASRVRSRAIKKDWNLKQCLKDSAKAQHTRVVCCSLVGELGRRLSVIVTIQNEQRTPFLFNL